MRNVLNRATIVGGVAAALGLHAHGQGACDVWLSTKGSTQVQGQVYTLTKPGTDQTPATGVMGGGDLTVPPFALGKNNLYWDGAAVFPTIWLSFDAPVRAMAGFNGWPGWGGKIVGGDFVGLNNGLIPCNYIVGLTSTPPYYATLGSGTNAPVRALLTISGTTMFVGGDFTQAGGLAANHVARWNATGWFTLGTGVDGPARALLHVGTDIVVGGDFANAGGVAAPGVASWTGQVWKPLGSGLNGSVHALALHEGSIYAGGTFTSAGGQAASRVARWNGSAWSALGAGVAGGATPIVRALAAYDGRLYAGGEFSLAGGVSTNNIARWDGASWSPLGDGTNGAVFAMHPSYTELLVGGSFTKAGGVDSPGLARWNTTGEAFILQHPSPVDVAIGDTAVTGAVLGFGYDQWPPLQYQWRKDDVAIQDGPGGASPGGGTVIGARSLTLTIENCQLGDDGYYDCEISSPCASITTGQAWIDVDPDPCKNSCYTECECDGVLSINDFICFQTLFALGDPYADCDGDSVLTVDDFICYQTFFAIGC